MNRPPAAILPKKPATSAMLPKDCPTMTSHAMNVGIFLECQLFKRFLDSPTAKPWEEFLHSVWKNDESSNNPQKGPGVVWIRVK